MMSRKPKRFPPHKMADKHPANMEEKKGMRSTGPRSKKRRGMRAGSRRG
jgi:hypothetical protein